MRSTLAAASDTIVVALFAFLGFRFALWATPCANQSICFPLTPAILACMAIAVILYFTAAQLLWKTTPGQKIFLSGASDEEKNEP